MQQPEINYLETPTLNVEQSPGFGDHRQAQTHDLWHNRHRLDHYCTLLPYPPEYLHRQDQGASPFAEQWRAFCRYDVRGFSCYGW